MTFVTSAEVASEKIQTIVRAVMRRCQALVEIYASSLIFWQKDVSFRTFAVITSLEVDTLVGTAGMDVVLKLFALVDILAGMHVRFETESRWTRTCHAVSFRVNVTGMRTVSIVNGTGF